MSRFLFQIGTLFTTFSPQKIPNPLLTNSSAAKLLQHLERVLFHVLFHKSTFSNKFNSFLPKKHNPLQHQRRHEITPKNAVAIQTNSCIREHEQNYKQNSNNAFVFITCSHTHVIYLCENNTYFYPNADREWEKL